MVTKAKTAAGTATEEEKAKAAAEAAAKAGTSDTGDTGDKDGTGDTGEAKEEVVVESAPTWEATLKYGETYFLRGVKFLKGVPKKVTDEVKVYLESTAIDTVTVGSKTRKSNETRAKFEFVRLRSR